MIVLVAAGHILDNHLCTISMHDSDKIGTIKPAYLIDR